jgi:hypothetical protein
MERKLNNMKSKSISEISRKLEEGVLLYVDEQLDKAPFDKTDTAIITGTSEFGYTLLFKGKEYRDIKTIGGSCLLNETVNIVIPQNNMNNMFILKPPGIPEGNKNIVNGEDLNNYKAIGKYYCTANVTAQTLLNCPTSSGSGTAFNLKIEYPLGHTGYISQELITFDTGTRYFRCFDVIANSWYPWRVGNMVMI